MDLGVGRARRAGGRGVLSDLDAWIADTFGHAPADPALWCRALTHSSRADEESYERLEFLGDRVLGLSMAEWLYELFPGDPEGMLSRRINVLVSGATCADVAREIGLPERVRLDKGVKATTRDSDNVLGDVVEALLGALYLEGGLEPARRWIRQHWERRVHSAVSARKHPKAALQEWSEANGRGLPRYAVVDGSGPDHARSFTVSVRVGEREEQATASSKREAETAAAEALLAAIEAEKQAKRVRVKKPRTVLPSPRQAQA